ncbi:hypothetical protein GCM10011297_31500 [Bacterioplanes sanyensis]|uniref:DUF2164 domain-containing protein n=1 Tax=Bacterioplanes sanyensis TaxID=1249553 RepID=UPI00167690B6|nr:DUF2164 domain-containing protein [Bacterioplanes sanyensis]GGY56405.1 hypothetical protein GCM10011297_31500 [Bacterioplanes sanyensis]
MKELQLSAQQKQDMVARVKSYFEREMQSDIGGFEAEFLIDFFVNELGGHFYNQGLFDAQQLLNEKLDEMNYSLQELEKPLS